jgi:integrase
MRDQSMLTESKNEAEFSPQGLRKRFSHEAFLAHAQTILPEGVLDESRRRFQEDRKRLNEEIRHFWRSFGDMTLLALFSIWVEERPDTEVIENREAILAGNFIKFQDASGEFLQVRDLKSKEFLLTLENIRCQGELSAQEQERWVEIFVDFHNWMSLQSISYIPEIVDPDKERTRNRALSHADFVRLIGCLDDRCRLVSKLLYFGGNRTIEQIIEIDIENIDFEKHFISFDSSLYSYPLHVFRDIRRLIGSRASGQVFVGRQNSPINPSTIFRNVKEAAVGIGLGDLFSPKILTQNR